MMDFAMYVGRGPSKEGNTWAFRGKKKGNCVL